MKTQCLFLVLFLFALFISTAELRGQIPRTLSYQGVLTDALGNPAPDGDTTFTFRLYEAASGETAIWEETKTITITRGLFSTMLGDVTAFGANVLFDRPYWLSVQVKTGPELSPRIPLSSVGYSISSINADTAEYALSAPMQTVVDSSRIAGTIPDNTVKSANIVDGTIQFADIGQNSAAAGQVMKWNGTAWVAANDSLGITGGPFLPLAGGTMTGAITNTGDPPITMGKGNFGSGNTNTGTNAFVAGENNTASGVRATVSGGFNNTATNAYATVGGGQTNNASNIYATVGGGFSNSTTGDYSTVSGGRANKARGLFSVVGGGGGLGPADSNSASGSATTVAGGRGNIASGLLATVGGGFFNVANAERSTVAGGGLNSASAYSATVNGGSRNTASTTAATVGGGSFNSARGVYSVVSGGGGGSLADSNSALGDYSTVSGGRANRATTTYATVGGGQNNTASDIGATVSGGLNNTASGDQATIGGGRLNGASNFYATVGGGWSNTASGSYATVPGGHSNRAAGSYSLAAGTQARANHAGAVVIAATDPTADTVSSGGFNQMVLRGDGGVYITNVGGSAPTSLNILTIRQNTFLDPIADAWTNYSSRRWKTNIKTLENALDKIQQLRGVSYDSKADGKHDVGLIAEEVGEVIPEVVEYEENGVDAKSVDYARLVALLIEGIKTQQKEIEELKAIVKSHILEKGMGRNPR